MSVRSGARSSIRPRTGARDVALGLGLATVIVGILATTTGSRAHAAQPTDLGRTDTGDGARRSIAIWAAPGLTRNPVSFTMSPDGRVWVAESDRAGNAVTDTRQLGHLDAVWNDGQLRTVEDRRALIQRWLDDGHFDADYFTRTEDRVRVVRDTDGDGVADDASVFAGGFDDAVDGIGSGVVWSDGALLYTNIPHLWSLRDRDGDGVIADDPAAGERTAVSSGYGIRWCFYGHDLHGLVEGPDGRVWFTVGDRGYNVTTMEGRRLVGTDRGAAFRCWPDGTGLELVHEGLRNPQELAFDVLGNAFTGDNNCDSGDRARVTVIVEGADSGWRQDVQSLPSRGPWNRESMWRLIEDDGDLVDPGRPAWVLPPIAHVGAGPSGFALQPGTGESGHADGALMLVDFYGSGARVHAFHMAPRGAWFSLEDRRDYYRGATVTDIAWGADGRLYMSDWGGGWSPNPNGRMLVVTNEDVHADPDEQAVLAEVQAFLQADPGSHTTDALLVALDHRDQRVRHAAQMELARRGGWRATRAGTDEVTDAPPAVRQALVGRIAADIRSDDPDLGAVHAVWALGQIARRDPLARQAIVNRLDHADPIVRTQLVRTAADLRLPARATYLAGLADDHAPARAAAALALARTGGVGLAGDSGDSDTMVRLLDAANRDLDRDPVLRHLIAYALASCATPEQLATRLRSTVTDGGTTTPEPARLALALALRHQAVVRVGEDVPADGRRHIARFWAGRGFTAALRDPSPRVAAAAARAIYDLHLDAPEPFSPGGPKPGLSSAAALLDGGGGPGAFAALAAMLDDIDSERLAIEPIVRRVVAANLRLAAADAGMGTPSLGRIVRFAARPGVPSEWRLHALDRLETWAAGDRRERVWGHWIPRPGRSVDELTDVLGRYESALLAGAGDDRELRFRIDRLRARLLLTMSADEVLAALTDASADPRFRAVLLEEAARRDPGRALDLCETGLSLDGDDTDVVRMAALDVLAEGDRAPERLFEAAVDSVTSGTLRERQHAVRRLGALAAAVDAPMAEPAAEAIATLLAGNVPARPAPASDADTDTDRGTSPPRRDAERAPIHLELYRAALAMPEATPLHQAARAIDAAWSGRRPAGFADALLRTGGDPARGASLFRHHEAAQCLRCHRVGALGGNAGPELTAVGARLTAAQLVESVVEPGRTIVDGYGAVAAMPDITGILTPEETRDVIAYLASLDDPRSVRPAGRQIAPQQVLFGAFWHVLAAAGAVAVALVLAPRRPKG